MKQLTKLIEVTRTDLKKEDRQKVMNMITIDAHSRDMVESIVESGANRSVNLVLSCISSVLLDQHKPLQAKSKCQPDIACFLAYAAR